MRGGGAAAPILSPKLARLVRGGGALEPIRAPPIGAHNRRLVLVPELVRGGHALEPLLSPPIGACGQFPDLVQC